MKILGMLPIKNESAFIETFVSSMVQVCDEILVLDDNSTDNSVDLLSKYEKIKIIKLENNNDWSTKRAYLFDVARQHSATHMIALDADEAFTNNAIDNFDEILSKMKPGQKCTFHWLAMWKSLYHYRDDRSAWSNSFKDFLICDDGNLEYSGNWIHEPRLPITNNVIQIPLSIGGVFHFQFSSWDAFQIKQSWYRCLERVKNPNKSFSQINQTYSITLDDGITKLSEAEKEWYKNLKLPNMDVIYKNSLWRVEDIKNWINEFGIDHFKGLDIWHVKEIKNLIDG